MKFEGFEKKVKVCNGLSFSALHNQYILNNISALCASINFFWFWTIPNHMLKKNTLKIKSHQCGTHRPVRKVGSLLRTTTSAAQLHSTAKKQTHVYYSSTAPPFILLLLLYTLRVSSREPIHASFSKGGILI